jgi:hypothetical protein
MKTSPYISLTGPRGKRGFPIPIPVPVYPSGEDFSPFTSPRGENLPHPHPLRAPLVARDPGSIQVDSLGLKSTGRIVPGKNKKLFGDPRSPIWSAGEDSALVPGLTGSGRASPRPLPCKPSPPPLAREASSPSRTVPPPTASTSPSHSRTHRRPPPPLFLTPSSASRKAHRYHRR